MVAVCNRTGVSAGSRKRGAGTPVPPGGFAAGALGGQRWSFELTPDGPDATIVTEIFDCSGVTGRRARGYRLRQYLGRQHEPGTGAT